MTEYKITLFYDEPLPEYFAASLEQMFISGVECGLLTGYEFKKEVITGTNKFKKSVQKQAEKIQKDFQESLKNGETDSKDDTPGHDTGTGKTGEVVHDEGETGRAEPEHKKAGIDPADSGKKESGKV